MTRPPATRGYAAARDAHEGASRSGATQAMKRTVLTFGSISGVILSVMVLATVPFIDRIGFDKSEIVGYTIIVLSFLLVFFGIRSYRESSGGRLTFARGFTVGILITLITCAFYVVTWEIIYFTLMPDFADKYSAYMVEHLKASGATQASIDASMKQMEGLKRILDNPLTNAAATFTEPFPIGLVVTLVSAAVLRKK
jgi:uncharacterized protein DUF4199